MLPENEKENLKILAEGLSIFGVEDEDAILIVQLMVGLPKETKKLIYWMTENPKAAPAEISAQALMLWEKRETNPGRL